MRLRFWRKKEAEKFDPEAGEIPEFLEVWPETPFLRRKLGISVFWAVCRGAAAVSLTSLVLRTCDSATMHEPKPWPLRVLEAATLQQVCAEDSHFLTLRGFAPCDAEARVALRLQSDRTYYVALASQIGSYSSLTPAYLLDGECYDAVGAQSESVDHCVVAELRKRPG